MNGVNEISVGYKENTHKSRVLIFEDSEAFTEILKRILEKEYDILMSDSAENAMELSYNFNPDVILLDIKLTGNVSGLEFLQSIKKNTELSHIPVILISAISSSDIISDGLRYGANDYLVKPFDIQHLHFRIKNMLLLFKKVKQMSLNEQFIPLKTTQEGKQSIINSLNKIVDSSIASKVEISIVDIANTLSVSQSTLGRLIKSEFGVTVNNYVLYRKLEKAKLMIATNADIPIKEVAFLLGFSSVSYFSKCFKIRFGYTPSEKQRLERDSIC